MKQNDHIPKDNALRQALRQRAERCTAENPVPADLEGLVMQRILRNKQQPATRRRSLLRLLPWSIAAALLVGFTLMKALYQLPHEGEKTLSPLPREGESLATLESSRQVGNFTSHEEEGKVLAMLPSIEEVKAVSHGNRPSRPTTERPTPSRPSRPTLDLTRPQQRSSASVAQDGLTFSQPDISFATREGGEFLSPDRQADTQVPPRGDLEGALLSLKGGGGDGSDGGGPEESSPIPPDKQALADIYLAEVALQVAYRKQAAEEAVRAYQAGITGEETQQPIIAF
ncbi:MAG: hypothetical protein IJ767_04475 [Bacteroidaceae bacterium]|nr:hypothetical protein [Bacteroidaceae bacterium]